MKKAILVLALALLMVSATGCANYDFGETGQYIVTAKDALSLAQQGAIFVDAQPQEDYAAGHIEGAVNIPMSSLVVNEPYDNMLPAASRVKSIMGGAGIKETNTILVYDNNANMQAARIQWTLNVYGNFNVKVVSGGLKALKAAGAAVSAEATMLPSAVYVTKSKNNDIIVSLDEIKTQINTPDTNTVIIDTRSDDEYYAGTIPGSVHIEYLWNDYASGQYKSVMDLQNTYLEKKIMPDMKIILFCKTSVRAAQTYAALKDAGYKDVRVYDGAWLEYSAVENPSATVTTAPSKQSSS